MASKKAPLGFETSIVPTQIYFSHVGPGVEDEGMRSLSAVQLLSYLYREPDEKISEDNPAFCVWSMNLGLDPKALAVSMKKSPERLRPYKGCDSHKIDHRDGPDGHKRSYFAKALSQMAKMPHNSY